MSRPRQARVDLASLLRRSGLDVTATPCSGAYGNPDSVYEMGSPQTTLAELLTVGRRQVARWAHDGIPLSSAEDACEALGLHPCEVWGDVWLAAVLGPTPCA